MKRREFVTMGAALAVIAGCAGPQRDQQLGRELTAPSVTLTEVGIGDLDAATRVRLTATATRLQQRLLGTSDRRTGGRVVAAGACLTTLGALAAGADHADHAALRELLGGVDDTTQAAALGQYQAWSSSDLSGLTTPQAPPLYRSGLGLFSTADPPESYLKTLAQHYDCGIYRISADTATAVMERWLGTNTAGLVTTVPTTGSGTGLRVLSSMALSSAWRSPLQELGSDLFNGTKTPFFGGRTTARLVRSDRGVALQLDCGDDLVLQVATDPRLLDDPRLPQAPVSPVTIALPRWRLRTVTDLKERFPELARTTYAGQPLASAQQIALLAVSAQGISADYSAVPSTSVLPTAPGLLTDTAVRINVPFEFRVVATATGIPVASGFVSTSYS